MGEKNGYTIGNYLASCCGKATAAICSFIANLHQVAFAIPSIDSDIEARCFRKLLLSCGSDGNG